MSQLEDLCRRLEVTCSDLLRTSAELLGQARRLRVLASEVAAVGRSQPESARAAGHIVAALEQAEHACTRTQMHLLATSRVGVDYIDKLRHPASVQLSGKHVFQRDDVVRKPFEKPDGEQIEEAPSDKVGVVLTPVYRTVVKYGMSTTFPESWTEGQTKAAIREAWRDHAGTRGGQPADQSTFWPPNPDLDETFEHVFSGHVVIRPAGTRREKRRSGKWSGTGGGLHIEGFFDLDTGECSTAYPVQ